jgi:lipopolysaccharide transport system permease protein
LVFEEKVMANHYEKMPTQVIGQVTAGRYLADLWRYRHLALHLSSADLQNRFRRSALGVLWAMIHPLAFTLLYSVMLSMLFRQDLRELSIYVFSGIVLWETIAAYINAGAVTFLTGSGYLKQAPIPLLLFPIRTCITATTVALLGFASFALYVLALTTFGGLKPIFSLYWLWIFPVVGALFVVGIPWATIIGLMNLKFRDTQQLLVIAMQAIWFASPIFFQRELFDAPGLNIWSMINPVIAFCDALRNPILYQKPPELVSWIVIGVWAVASWAVALIILATDRRRALFYM